MANNGSSKANDHPPGNHLTTYDECPRIVEEEHEFGKIQFGVNFGSVGYDSSDLGIGELRC